MKYKADRDDLNFQKWLSSYIIDKKDDESTKVFKIRESH